MQERNYLSISLFILVILLLLLGGNFLIKNNYSPVSKDNSNEIKDDVTKDYIYYTDNDIVSYALDLSYPTIHININSTPAKDLETSLNSRMAKFKDSVVKLSETNVKEEDIVYEIGNEDIYAADFLKYDTYESDDYLTLEVSSGHLDITKEEEPTYLEYYTFDKKTGQILTDAEIQKIGMLTDEEIKAVQDKYEKDNGVSVKDWHLYLDKYKNVVMNLLVNAGDITYNDTVKI